MTSHTKGPWRYEGETKTIRAVPENYWLATMDSWDGAVDNEANARLIAAAPEMLEALKTFLTVAEDNMAYDASGAEGSEDRKAYLAVQAARAIIAKAEGRTE